MALRRVSLLIPTLLLAACGPAPTPPKPGPESDVRLVALRDSLRSRLGECYDEPIPAATAEQLQRGAKRFDLLCAGCHGRTGWGDGRASAGLTVPPPDLADPARAAFWSDRARLAIIREGIEGSPMIGWSGVLGEDELLDVFQFTRSLADSPEPLRSTQ